MGLFRHRPLFLCCSVFLCASVLGLAFYCGGASPSILFWGTFALISMLVAGGVIGCVYLYKHGRIRAAVLVGCAILSALVAIGGSLSFFAGPQAVYLKEQMHERVVVRGVITEIRGSGGYMTSFSMDMEDVGGQSCHGMAILTCHYLSALQPGQVVEMEVEVLPLDEATGERYDATSLRGDGYRIGFLSEDEDSLVVLGTDAENWAVRSGKWRRLLGARLHLSVGDEAKGLPSALFLDDTSALDDAVRRDFARSGTSHVLAISGMHMTLLFGMLEVVLRCLRVPRKVRVILLGIGAFLYLFVIGFTPSATRAVIMLGMVYLSVLNASRADPVTSLGLSSALILLITPYAVADAGFWMSYLATLALVVLSPVLQKYAEPRPDATGKIPFLRRVGAFLRKQVLGVLIGIVAMTMTLFVVAGVIGEFGVSAPIGTLLLTPLSAIVLVASPLSLLFFGTGIGDVIASVASVVTEWMLSITEWLARPSWAVVSLRHPAVLPITILIVFAFVWLLCIRLPKWRQWVICLPVLIGWLLLGGLWVVERTVPTDVSGTYLSPSSDADMLVLVEGYEGIIIDLSNGSHTSMRAAMDEAKCRGATEISALVLTHYHSRMTGTLFDTLNGETVRSVWLPIPVNTEEYYLMTAYMEKAERAGVAVTVYGEGEAVPILGTHELTLQRTRMERSVQPVLLLSVQDLDGKETLLYCGASVFESDLAIPAEEMIRDADVVILGHHGPIVKEGFGTQFPWSEDTMIILSDTGDEAYLLDAGSLPSGGTVWLGPVRFWP